MSVISVPYLERIRSLPPGLLYPHQADGVQYCYYFAPNINSSNTRIDIAVNEARSPTISASLVPELEGRWQKISVVEKMRTQKLRLFLRLEEWLQRRLRAKLLPMVGRFAIALAFVASIANASPLDPGQVEVLDGDTIRVAGETFRLVGFDAPETYRARCASERDLGNRATFRLRQLVAGGGLDVERVTCACPTATQGTRRCNYGRSCGTLKAHGQDVSAVLLAEGLVRVYVCGRTSCPPRESWCPFTQFKDEARYE